MSGLRVRTRHSSRGNPRISVSKSVGERMEKKTVGIDGKLERIRGEIWDRIEIQFKTESQFCTCFRYALCD